MKIFGFFTLVGILVWLGSFDNKAQAQHDSGYIRQFPERLIVSPHYDLRSYRLRFRYQGNKNDQTALFYPTVRNVIGLRLAYKGITFGLATRGPRTNFQRENFGKTRYTDFTLKYDPSSYPFVVEWSFKKYNTLTDLNTPNYTSDWQEGSDFYIRDDLRALYTKINFTYFFARDKFSYRSAFDFIDKQQKSAGSLLLLGSLSVFSVKGDSSFIAEPITDAFGPFSSLKKLSNFGVGLGPGYAYNYVYNDFSVSAAGFGGLEIQRNKFFLEENNTQNMGLQAVPLVGVKVGAGYNTRKFFAGVSGNFDFNFFTASQLRVHGYSHNIAFLIGFRMDAPRITEKLDELDPRGK